MSCINILAVEVKNNPSNWLSSFIFDIQFEALKSLSEDLEWKVIYVGSSESEEYDQVLDSVQVGPILPGINKFLFVCDPPDINRIPANDVLGVTVLLLTCSYKGVEFIRIGYYVNNEYDNDEMRECPPREMQPERIMRSILADKPRVTRFQADFD